MWRLHGKKGGRANDPLSGGHGRRHSERISWSSRFKVNYIVIKIKRKKKNESWCSTLRMSWICAGWWRNIEKELDFPYDELKFCRAWWWRFKWDSILVLKRDFKLERYEKRKKRCLAKEISDTNTRYKDSIRKDKCDKDERFKI